MLPRNGKSSLREKLDRKATVTAYSHRNGHLLLFDMIIHLRLNWTPRLLITLSLDDQSVLQF